jgi:hypothetical protein
MARADYVVWTEADVDLHATQIERVLRRLA